MLHYYYYYYYAAVHNSYEKVKGHDSRQLEGLGFRLPAGKVRTKAAREIEIRREREEERQRQGETKSAVCKKALQALHSHWRCALSRALLHTHTHRHVTLPLPTPTTVTRSLSLSLCVPACVCECAFRLDIKRVFDGRRRVDRSKAFVFVLGSQGWHFPFGKEKNPREPAWVTAQQRERERVEEEVGKKRSAEGSLLASKLRVAKFY